MDNNDNPTGDEEVLRNAVQFLIDGNEFYAAQLLLHCDISIDSRYFRVRHPREYDVYYLTIVLSGPRLIYDAIGTNGHNRQPIGTSIYRAFEAVIRQDQGIEKFSARMRPTPIEASEWRAKLWEEIDGLKASLEENDNGNENEAMTQELEDQRMAAPIAAPEPDTRKVFVVYGRNLALRNAMFTFLRSVDLQPIEWEQAVQATGKASPYIGDVLDAGFAMARAVVVMITPDDEARLLPDFQGQHEPEYETQLTPQARPNVLFEAGMAFGRHENRTVLVEFGTLRPVSDVGGRHTIRMDGSTAKRQALAQRLANAGCQVDMSGTDWHDAGDFTIPSPPKKDMLTDDGRPSQESRVQRLRDQYAQMLEGVQLLYRAADAHQRLVGTYQATPKRLQGVADTAEAAMEQIDDVLRDLRVQPGTAEICDMVETLYAEREQQLLVLDRLKDRIPGANLVADMHREAMKNLIPKIRKAVEAHLASFS